MDGKLWRTVTDIDIAVVKKNPKNNLSEVVHLEQIKSGERDMVSTAKEQLNKTLGVLNRVASGDTSVGISERNGIFDNVTSSYDLSNLDGAAKITRGPSRKDNKFDASIGLTAQQIKQLSKEIIKEKNP